jgi:hypothetical protein
MIALIGSFWCLTMYILLWPETELSKQYAISIFRMKCTRRERIPDAGNMVAVTHRRRSVIGANGKMDREKVIHISILKTDHRISRCLDQNYYKLKKYISFVVYAIGCIYRYVYKCINYICSFDIALWSGGLCIISRLITVAVTVH